MQTRRPSFLLSFSASSFILVDISFIAYLHVNLRANSPSSFSFFNRKTARMKDDEFAREFTCRSTTEEWHQDERSANIKAARKKDDEFARKFTCKLVVLQSCCPFLRPPFLLLSFPSSRICTWIYVRTRRSHPRISWRKKGEHDINTINIIYIYIYIHTLYIPINHH